MKTFRKNQAKRYAFSGNLKQGAVSLFLCVLVNSLVKVREKHFKIKNDQSAQLFCFKPLFFRYFVLLLLFYSSPQFAQVPTFLREDNDAIRSKAEMVDMAGWVFFLPDANIAPNELFTSMKSDFGLGVNDEMVLKKNWSDKYEYNHNRYQQYHKGLKVEGAEFTTHYQNNGIEIAHGKLVENLQINAIPNIAESEALNLAMAELGANQYAWQSDEWEQALKADLEDANATYLPDGELYLVRLNGDKFLPENFKVAWEFRIRAISPSMLKKVAVDAHTGKILRIREVAHHNGPAVTMYNGTQTIDTEWRGIPYNNHRLKTNDNGREIHTKIGTFGVNNFFSRSNVTDKDDNWDVTQDEATSAHWGVTQSWDYFKDVHGRAGFDNNNREVRVWASSTENNARYLPNPAKNHDYLEFGSLNNGNNLASLDICGHEFAHGVTFHTAGLGLDREPGALNESFSDIFGFLIERHENGGVVNDWLIGEDPLPAGTVSATLAGLRSLSNPGAFNLPHTYLTAGNWFAADAVSCTTPFDGNDFCGVHTNCGVQNFWFHLLSMGGIHNTQTISSIGIDEAADIVYLNLTAFMQNASQYTDARLGSIAAARIIFGHCSFEEIQTTNAWAACGVGGQFDMNCASIQGPSYICVRGEEPPYIMQAGPIVASAAPNVTFTWTYHFAWNVTLSGAGNNTLTLNSLNMLPPYFPYTYTITATSSTGSVVTHKVTLEDCIRKRSELNTSNITIKPNPVTNLLTIDTPSADKKQISIYDMNGKLVLSKESSDKTVLLNTAHLASGVYSMSIQTDTEIYTSKFIKQ